MTSPKLAQYYSEKDGDGRRYRHPLTGEYLISVTSVLKEENKDNLIQWAANLTLEWCIEHAAELLGSSNEQGTKRGRYRWRDTRDERAGVGDGVHATIEAMHKGNWDYPELDDEQQQIMEQWEDLNTVHDIKPVYSELTVWQKGSHAGTLDGLWWIDGKLYLVDIKTSKNHWPGHDYQLSALAFAEKALIEKVPDADPKKPEDWEEIDNPAHVSKIDGAMIIHLRADKWALIPVKHLKENYDIFTAYRDVVYSKIALKEIQNNEEEK